jgi:hypothetical protein
MSCLNCCKRPTVINGRKVTFNETVTVFYFNKVLVEPNVCWRQAARDRLRFKRRMLDVEQKIGWVLAPQHRIRVFSTLVTN